jgi:hypothetical protein
MKLITLDEVYNEYNFSIFIKAIYNFYEYCEIKKNKGYKII